MPVGLAGIFLGDIQTWSDPRLVVDNPSLAGVDQEIVVVHRSDGSGTTFGFTDYLSSVSPAWQQQVGKGTSVNWPVGLGGSGNPGVAGEVQQNCGVALTRLLWWATHEAQRFNADLAYATVPAEITARSEGFIRQISFQDQPVFPGR